MPRADRSEFTANLHLEPLTFTPFKGHTMAPRRPNRPRSLLPLITWGTLAVAALLSLFA